MKIFVELNRIKSYLITISDDMLKTSNEEAMHECVIFCRIKETVNDYKKKFA